MESIQVRTTLPAVASQIFDDWLDSDKHTAFTGGEAEIRRKANALFTAWDGYIHGKILEFEEGERILMEWATSEFPSDAEPSLVEVLLSDLEDECEIIINHSNIPVNQGLKYKDGWVEHYFEPMRDYYSQN